MITPDNSETIKDLIPRWEVVLKQKETELFSLAEEIKRRREVIEHYKNFINIKGKT